MLLPENFVFTQQNLQNYVDCQYRFYLREIKKLDWPAVESEPIREQEELMLLGTRFHLLCQQYLSGIPAEVISMQITQPELAEWWKSFLLLNLNLAPGSFYAEKLFSIPFAGYRLAAKVDLLVKKGDGKILIYDWKTSQHQPKRQTMLNRMQSKVYPFVAAQSQPQQSSSDNSIEMVYWYPAFPDSPIKFFCSQSQLDDDQTKLEILINEIISKQENDFEKVSEDKLCRYCRYRSLCNRGISAGVADELSELSDMEAAFDLDFDAI